MVFVCACDVRTECSDTQTSPIDMRKMTDQQSAAVSDRMCRNDVDGAGLSPRRRCRFTVAIRSGEGVKGSSEQVDEAEK